MNINSNPNLVEGVGDEVLVTTGILIAIFLVLSLLLFKFKRSSVIHPSSQDDIDSTRRQLNIIYSNRFFEPTSELLLPDTNRIPSDSTRVQNSQHFGMDSQCPVCLNEPHFPVGKF